MNCRITGLPENGSGCVIACQRLPDMAPLFRICPKDHPKTVIAGLGKDVWRAYKQSDGDGFGQIRIKSDTEDEDKKEKAKILCKYCKNKITSNDARIPVAGKQQHVFSNPSGFVYEIGCFSFAYGCVNHGPPTLEFTWFAGYAWRFALCSACHSHLGWFYQSRENSFYGLILDYLVEGH